MHYCVHFAGFVRWLTFPLQESVEDSDLKPLALSLKALQRQSTVTSDDFISLFDELTGLAFLPVIINVMNFFVLASWAVCLFSVFILAFIICPVVSLFVPCFVYLFILSREGIL